MSDLLPPNATAPERALSEATARVGGVAVPVGDLWNPDACPAQILPWLAWSFSVDDWPAWLTTQQQRDTIKASLYIHQHKGTAGAVLAALESVGIGAQLVEWFQDSPVGAPYTFRINLDATQTPITQQTLTQLLDSVDAAKNVRSHLAAVTPGATSRAEVFVATVPSVGSEIDLTNYTGTLKLDGTWQLDASQMLDGFKRADTHTLNGAWSLNGATILNGISV